MFGIDDISLPFDMFANARTYSEDEILLFFRLVKEHYQLSNQQGIFLDIGANIGTTSIYVYKNISSDIGFIAFEPDPFTFKMLKANCIINDCENIKCVHTGISSSEGTAKMFVFPENRGRNAIIDNQNRYIYDKDDITVPIITLDGYIKKHAIDPNNIQYLWIDTEGHEAEVIKGMENLLMNRKIPIFMEYNAYNYTTELVGDMQRIFSYQYQNVIAIHVGSGKIDEFEIGHLGEFSKHATEQYNIFLY